MFVPFVSQGAFPGGRGRPSWPTSASTVPWPLRADCTDALDSFPDLGEGPRAKDFEEYKSVLARADGAREPAAGLRGLHPGGAGPGRVRPLVGAEPVEASGSRRLPHDGARGLPRRRRRGGALGAASRGGRRQPGGRGGRRPAGLAARPGRAAARTPARVGACGGGGDAAAAGTAGRGGGGAAGCVPGRPGPHPGVGRPDAALLEEARARHATVRDVRLPDAVSASTLMRALAEPDAVAARAGPSDASTAGSGGPSWHAFHAWVETRYGQQSLLDPDDLPGLGRRRHRQRRRPGRAARRPSRAARTPVARRSRSRPRSR